MTIPLSGCGGGGGGGDGLAGISTGGTGSFTVGPISGFGSIIVNGIRYDDTGAEIGTLDGEGRAGPPGLGMVVSIQGSTVSGSVASGNAVATASRILYVSEWLGPIGSVNPASGTFQIFGQTVRTSASTLFTGSGATRFADVSPGLHAEVYGFVDPASATLQATRVELSTAIPTFHRLSGLVSNQGTEAFSLGSVRIAVGTAEASGWKEGDFVRVVLATQPDGIGRRIATRITPAAAVISALEIEDDDTVELKGTVTGITGANTFGVNGIPVDTGRLGPVAGLGLSPGIVVKVEGVLGAGVVIATEVKVEDAESEDEDFEFHGTVEALDPAARTFVVRGQAIRYDATTRFELEGATWSDGLRVEVDAVVRDGRLLATEISADD